MSYCPILFIRSYRIFYLCTHTHSLTHLHTYLHFFSISWNCKLWYHQTNIPIHCESKILYCWNPSWYLDDKCENLDCAIGRWRTPNTHKICNFIIPPSGIAGVRQREQQNENWMGICFISSPMTLAITHSHFYYSFQMHEREGEAKQRDGVWESTNDKVQWWVSIYYISTNVKRIHWFSSDSFFYYYSRSRPSINAYEWALLAHEQEVSFVDRGREGECERKRDSEIVTADRSNKLANERTNKQTNQQNSVTMYVCMWIAYLVALKRTSGS